MFDEIKIEEIKLGDYAKLKDIVNQQQLYHYHLNGPYNERYLKINETNFEEFMKRKKSSITYVAIIDNKIIGFTSSYINNYKEGVVEDLFISEEYRHKSIGKVLFQKSLQWLQENNVDTVDVHVAVGNENVIKFYEKYGFRTTGYTMRKVNEKDYKNTNEEG